MDVEYDWLKQDEAEFCFWQTQTTLVSACTVIGWDEAGWSGGFDGLGSEGCRKLSLQCDKLRGTELGRI